MTTYFVLHAETTDDDLVFVGSLLGTITVDGEDLLLPTDNAILKVVSVKFPQNIMNGVVVRNALGLTYKDVDIDRTYDPTLVYVPIDREFWQTNQVRGGFEFETDHVNKRFHLNTPEEIERARWWNTTMTGQSWEELVLKVRRSYSDKSVKVTALEKEAYETWG